MRLLHAMVDILSNKNALNACIVAMELCQMVTQALHTKDSFLLQLPGVTRALAEKCEAAGVEELGGLQEMDDAARRRLLALPDAAYADVAAFCNRYPDDVSVVFAVTNGKDVSAPDDEDSRAFEVDGDAGVVRCFSGCGGCMHATHRSEGGCLCDQSEVEGMVSQVVVDSEIMLSLCSVYLDFKSFLARLFLLGDHLQSVRALGSSCAPCKGIRSCNWL